MYYSSFTTKTLVELEKIFATSQTQGLSDEQALERQKKYGPNKLASTSIHWWNIAARQFSSPFLIILIIATSIAFFLGEMVNAITILIIILFNTVCSFIQEYRAEKVLYTLRSLIRPQVIVIRSGKQAIRENSQLVPGDILVIQPGDILSADVRIIKSDNLVLDESTLTGESSTVNKISNELPSAASDIYHATNCAFAGTTVVSGSGHGIVIGTGNNTVFGSVVSLSTSPADTSVFSTNVGKLSAFLLKIIVITLVGVFLIHSIFKSGNTSITQIALFSLALAIAITPEALPAVTTIALTRGALELAKHKVVAKRLSALEDLGSIEILCSDKTGTLTENTLSVAQVYTMNASNPLHIWQLCLNHQPLTATRAFDTALEEYSEIQGITKPEKTIISEIPFDPVRRRTTTLVQAYGEYYIIMRGSAPTVTSYCSQAPTEKESLWVNQEETQGNRVIMIAFKKTTFKPSSLDSEEHSLTAAGYISFEDPIKPTTYSALESAKKLGVGIKILTGDSAEVAGATAVKIGLIQSNNEVITGTDFERLSTTKKQRATTKYAVFARVTPEQKNEIIELLKKKHMVGFLGEGINDAPALKAAHVGIVVDNSTDTAKETADIVLLEKSLFTIVDGIRIGRTVFANTAKYLTITLSSNFGNFYSVAVASLFLDFLPMLPLQILLVNMLSDLPMISIATDTVDISQIRKPLSYNAKELALTMVLFGLLSSFFDFIFSVYFIKEVQLFYKPIGH